MANDEVLQRLQGDQGQVGGSQVPLPGHGDEIENLNWASMAYRTWNRKCCSYSTSGRQTGIRSARLGVCRRYRKSKSRFRILTTRALKWLIWLGAKKARLLTAMSSKTCCKFRDTTQTRDVPQFECRLIPFLTLAVRPQNPSPVFLIAFFVFWKLCI